MDNGQIILFQTQGGETKIEVRLSNETVWLTADQMAELFQRNKSTISRHIKNVLESGELQRNSVVAENATTASDGKTYVVAYYNLDMIISVGYRVNSHRGVQSVSYTHLFSASFNGFFHSIGLIAELFKCGVAKRVKLINIGIFFRIYTVSYTHLDVYKRQHMHRVPSFHRFYRIPQQ